MEAMICRMKIFFFGKIGYFMWILYLLEYRHLFRKQHCRDYLDQFYASFDIHFDKWDCESNHVKEGLGIVDDLIGKKMAFLTKDNLWVLKNSNSDGKITLKRGDGSSLYFTRYVIELNWTEDSYLSVIKTTEIIIKTTEIFISKEKTLASNTIRLFYVGGKIDLLRKPEGDP